jgi:hypothetical protein
MTIQPNLVLLEMSLFKDFFKEPLLLSLAIGPSRVETVMNVNEYQQQKLLSRPTMRQATKQATTMTKVLRW